MGVPTIQPVATPIPSQDIKTPIGAFGGLQADALQKSGSDLEKAGTNLAGTADLIQQRYNQIAVDGAINQLQDQHYALTYGNPDAIFRLSGKDAMDKGPVVQQQIDDARKQIYAGLNNDYQRLQFDSASRRMQNITMSRVGEHITNQMHAWGTETSKAMVANAARSAGSDYDNEDAFNAAMDQAQQGAARATINSGNANDPQISANNRAMAVNSVVQQRFDGMYSGDPIKAGNWLLNGKTAEGTPVRSFLSGESGDRLIERAQNAQDKGFVDGLFQQYLGGAKPAGGAPVAPGSAGRSANTGPIADTTLPAEARNFLPALSGGEGNYNSPAPKGDKSGTPIANNRYQFLFRTWTAEAPKAGVNPNDHSPAAQDRVAWQYAQDTYRDQSGGRDLAADVREGGHEATIAQALNKVWPSLPGGSEQNTTLAQFSARLGAGGGANALPGSSPGSPAPVGAAVQQIDTRPAAISPALAAMPDESAMVNGVLQSYPAGPRRDKIVADVRSQMSLLKQSIATDQSDFVHTLPDLQSSLLAGNARPIPEDQIRHFLPPADAARTIENLHIAQTAGQEFRGIKWGAPQDVEAAGQRLLHELGMPGGTSIEDVPPPLVDENSDEAYRLRAGILTKFQEAVKARRAALESDPVNYVSSNPLVAAKAAAVQAAGSDPDKQAAAVKDYFGQILSIETQLGVTPDKQHVMTRAGADGEVAKILQADPSTNAAADHLNKMSTMYGDMWPQAYRDMVGLGKLPEGYRTLAEIPGAATRWDYNEMMRLTKLKGDKWLGDAGQSEGLSNIRQINNSVDADPNLTSLRSSLHVPGVFADDANYTRIRDSVKNLAGYYSAFSGMSAADALKKASDGIIGQKYDMEGPLRVSKGPNGENRLPVVASYADTLLSGMKAAELSPTQGRAAVAMPPVEANAGEIGAAAALDAQRQAEMLAQARSTGRWVTNPTDSGAYLVAQDHNGIMYPVRRANGSLVSFKFGDAIRSNAVPMMPHASVWEGVPVTE